MQIEELATKIRVLGAQRALVDACVAKAVAVQLKGYGIGTRHISDINPHLSDREIAEKVMQPDEILVTKDYGFYLRLGPDKAILVPLDALEVKRMKALGIRKVRLPKAERIALQQEYAEWRETGLLDLKVLIGLIFVFEIKLTDDVKAELMELYTDVKAKYKQYWAQKRVTK